MGERIHIAAEGEHVDQVYLIRKVSQDAVTLIYTPLGTNHELSHVAQANGPQQVMVSTPAQMPAEVAGSPLAQR